MIDKGDRDPNPVMIEKGGELEQAKRVGYGRVSTAEQSTEAQESALRAAGCELVFVEKVSSRAPLEKRKMLVAALGSLNEGDVLVVAKLDRLGRSQSEVIARIDKLQADGIHLKTLDGLLDTKALGLMAPLFIGLLSGLAEVERSLIRERTLESIAHRRKTGGDIGGRPPIATEKIEFARRLRDEGKTLREIASTLSISPSTAHRVTRDRVDARTGEGTDRAFVA